MKRKLKRTSLLAALGLLLTFVAACNEKQKAKDGVAIAERRTQYTCPMHPQVLSDHPGSCPICGMDLVPKSGNEKDTIKIPAGLDELIKAPNEVVVSNIGLVRPEKKVFDDSVSAPGVISYDTRRQYSLAARFGGRIEKLYLKYAYQPVRKGQVVAEIYSPELVTAQRELLYILKTDKENTPLVQGAIARLRFLGVSAGQINSLTRTGREQYRFPLYSPYEGYLTLANSTPPAGASQPQVSFGGAMSGGGGMGETGGMGGAGSGTPSPSSMQPNAGILLEGQYVTAGQTLFTIVNPSRLWAEINIGTSQAGAFRKGMRVTIVPDGSRPLSGKVELIQPFYSEGSTFSKVRVVINNSAAKLRIGQLVRAVTLLKGESGLWVPQVAVLDLGMRKVTFVRRGHTFMPVTISTGAAVKNWVQVKQGLQATDEIAANAQYLIDSESFIQTKEDES